MTDDHGDQFPGAVPPRSPSTPRPEAIQQRLVRMHAAYAEKINYAVQADRDELAHELARTFADELSGLPAGRRPVPRTRGVRPPGQAPARLARMSRFTRRSRNSL